MTYAGARPVTAPGWTDQPRTDLALIDCDVHHKVKKVDELFPYMPRVYRQQILEQGLRMAGSGYFNVTKTAVRTDLAESCDASMKPGYDGHAYGEDPEQAIRQHLDVWNVDYALLTGSTVSGASVLPDPDFAAAITRAFNDWSIEHWLARDKRF